MWIVEQRDPAGSWFVRATMNEQEDAEITLHYNNTLSLNNTLAKTVAQAPISLH